MGISIAVIGVISNGYTVFRLLNENAAGGYGLGTYIVSMLSPLWQGGVLVGIAKLIEKVGIKYGRME